MKRKPKELNIANVVAAKKKLKRFIEVSPDVILIQPKHLKKARILAGWS